MNTSLPTGPGVWTLTETAAADRASWGALEAGASILIAARVIGAQVYFPG